MSEQDWELTFRLIVSTGAIMGVVCLAAALAGLPWYGWPFN